MEPQFYKKKNSFKLSQNWIGMEKSKEGYEYGKLFTDSDTLRDA